MRYRTLLTIGLIIGMIGSLFTLPASSDESILHWQLTSNWPYVQHASIWPEIAHHFNVKHYTYKPSVKKQIHFLSHRQDYINELTGNAQLYLYFVYAETRKYKMPAEIALVPMIESDYNPFGRSRTGATGLWQMMPRTASSLGLKINSNYDGRRNVIKSTKAALNHLRYLHSYFKDWLLALAAYNSGDALVRSAIRYNKRHGLPTDFWHLKLPRETKLYVPKLLALATIIAKHKQYGISLEPIPNKPYFAAIKVKKTMSMSHVAKLAHTTLKIVHQLNPAFRQWSINPFRSYWLLLPENKADIFNSNLNGEKKSRTKTASIIRTGTQKQIIHVVKRGETLSEIGYQYHVSYQKIKQWNQLEEKKYLHIGEKLKIYL